MDDDFEALVDAARRGDATAIDTLCTRLYPRVRTEVHRSLATDARRGRPWLASLFSTGDVVQEVFLGVLRDLDGIRGRSEDAFVAYVTILTRNRLIDAIRFHQASRRDRRRVLDDADDVDVLDDHRGGPPEQAIAVEQVARFHRVLQSFSERDRALLRERIENEAPFERIARTLGYASADSARKAFHVAQARLLARLRRGQEASGAP